MRLSKEGRAEIIQYEGIITSVYYDTKRVLTLGIGHTRFDGIKPNPEVISKSKVFSLEEIFSIFNKSIVKYEDHVNNSIKVPLLQHEFDALVSFDYNTGGIARSTIAKIINKWDITKEEIDDLPIGGTLKHLALSIFNTIKTSLALTRSQLDILDLIISKINTLEHTGLALSINNGIKDKDLITKAFLMWNKPKEIIGRRTKEAKLFTTGKYSNDGTATLYETDGKGNTIFKSAKRINIMEYL
jgi:GH24 family phage-related lysozyme (muramidase)